MSSPGLAADGDDLSLRARNGLARDPRVRIAARPCDAIAAGGSARDAAVAPDDGAHGQVELAPPRDVGGVAERADHRDARALFGIGEMVGEDRHFDAEHRRAHRRAEQRLVAIVVGMRDSATHAASSSGRVVSMSRSLAAVGAVERERVIRAGPLFVFEFGLRDRGAEGDVPEARRFGLVRLAAGEVAQERALRHALAVVVDGGVAVRPVDREAEAPEECFERLLVLLRSARGTAR